MKTTYFYFIMLTLLCGGQNFLFSQSPKQWKTPEKLNIMQQDYPRTFYFRQTERPEYYMNYKDWQNEWDGLMGIQGKALGEELADRSLKHVKYYSQFKKDHPEQMVLLHFNGNACDPMFETNEFFDGHWLYSNGPKITDDIPENWTYSEIKVEDASYFVKYTGRFFDRKEDVAIVSLDENGKPDWFHCEQAIIRDIDYENNIITVARGAYKDRPLSFKAGKARVMAHVVEGPWFGGLETQNQGNNMLWYYNHSTTCPRDEKGRNCNDVMAELMAKRFLPGADLYYFDGFELDVLFNTLEHNSYFYLGDLGPDKKRAPDCDGDGVADMGFINGVNVYERGVYEYIKKQREELDKIDPNILFLADAGHKTQHNFGDLNGVESEGFHHWSNINTHFFWNVNAHEPRFSYINHKFKHMGENFWQNHRIALSAAMHAGSAVAQYVPQPPRNPDGSIGIWDEFVCGVENKAGWMGKPVADVVHLVEQEKDMLDGAKPSKKLINKMQFINCSGTIENGMIKVSGNASTGDMRIIIPDVELPDKEFTLAITSHCDPKKGYDPEYGRKMWVRPVDENGASILDSTEWYWKMRDRMFAYMNNKSFTNYIFFDDTEKTTINIEIRFVSHEPVYIKSLKLFAAPDAKIREFENALVITNPGIHDYIFDLEKLTPGKKYRRIKGFEYQDTVTNNGKPVDEQITLKKDALFLVKN